MAAMPSQHARGTNVGCGSSAQPSPTSDALLEGTQALDRHDCLCRLGFDSHESSEQMTLLWPTRILHAGLDRAQTGDSGFANVSHFMRDHRSQVVQNHCDCFLPQVRLCGDSMHEARLGQDRTCSGGRNRTVWYGITPSFFLGLANGILFDLPCMGIWLS